MKTISFWILATLFATTNLFSEVVVTFENPDEYRDIDFRYFDNRKGQKIYLPQFEKYIVKEGQRHLEEGQILKLTITDIDLAGEFEGWRPPPWDDVRIVKSIYPPRMSFSYELSDSDGNVIKSGEEKLVDLNFDFRVRFNSHDDLFYDKAMIKDWLRKFNKKKD